MLKGRRLRVNLAPTWNMPLTHMDETCKRGPSNLLEPHIDTLW